jgi:hypothetical protein
MIMPGYSSTVLEYFLDSGTSQLATGPPIDLLSNLYASTSQTCAGTWYHQSTCYRSYEDRSTSQLATGPPIDLLSNLYASTSHTSAGTTSQLATGPTRTGHGMTGNAVLRGFPALA